MFADSIIVRSIGGERAGRVAHTNWASAAKVVRAMICAQIRREQRMTTQGEQGRRARFGQQAAAGGTAARDQVDRGQARLRAVEALERSAGRFAV